VIVIAVVKNFAVFLLWNSYFYHSIYEGLPVTVEFRHLSLRCIYISVINVKVKYVDRIIHSCEGLFGRRNKILTSLTEYIGLDRNVLNAEFSAVVISDKAK
jgi:hypothetical protein